MSTSPVRRSIPVADQHFVLKVARYLSSGTADEQAKSHELHARLPRRPGSAPAQLFDCVQPLPGPFHEILVGADLCLDHSDFDRKLLSWWEDSKSSATFHHEMGSRVCLLVDRGGCGGWTTFTVFVPRCIHSQFGLVAPFVFLHSCAYSAREDFSTSLYEAFRSQFNSDDEVQAAILATAYMPASASVLQMLAWLGNKRPAFVALWLDAVLLQHTAEAIEALALLKRISMLDNVFLIISCSNPAALCLLIPQIDSRGFSLAVNIVPIELSSMCMFTEAAGASLFEDVAAFPWRDCLKLLREHSLPLTPALLMSVYHEQQERARQTACEVGVDVNFSFAEMLNRFGNEQAERLAVFQRHLTWLEASDLTTALSAWRHPTEADLECLHRYELLVNCLFDYVMNESGDVVIVGVCGSFAAKYFQCALEFSIADLLRASGALLTLHTSTDIDTWAMLSLQQQSVSIRSLESALEWPMFRLLWDAPNLKHVHAKWERQWPGCPGFQFVQDWLLPLADHPLLHDADHWRSLRQLLRCFCDGHFEALTTK
eukprot:TRINITY_DN158_c0_g1_i5.p1 TRINITY_DN158_c0_g1~~TRINITY_DN158_c0_g1_i5.p1  ORF type:complete len:543 (+),score=66.88 TRINITY_DN158_c0_g1_i5:45-1673(+)